eukprot:2529553-Alexandrium_andersonii.AAC.1
MDPRVVVPCGYTVHARFLVEHARAQRVQLFVSCQEACFHAVQGRLVTVGGVGTGRGCCACFAPAPAAAHLVDLAAQLVHDGIVREQEFLPATHCPAAEQADDVRQRGVDCIQIVLQAIWSV